MLNANTKAHPPILKAFLLLSFIIIITVNSVQLFKELRIIHKFKKIAPFSFVGLKFAGLEAVFKGVEVIGYYSDKDMNDTEAAKQFAQAQLVLAPTILELNNLDHELLLFDCTSEAVAFAKIKEINAVAIKKNNHGIILAKKIK